MKVDNRVTAFPFLGTKEKGYDGSFFYEKNQIS